jgi:hypothetical protein
MADVVQGDGEVEARAIGRARVADLLILPLSGLRRPTGKAMGDFAKLFAALPDRLAYMPEDALRGLAELTLRVAGGLRPNTSAKGPSCPHPSLILCWAYAMCPPPPRESDFARSLMRSVLGREAFDGRWHVELFRHARRFGPPPNAYHMTKIREEADANRRNLARVRERIDAGVASPDDKRWLASWHADTREAEALVAEGEDRRAAKAKPVNAEVDGVRQ